MNADEYAARLPPGQTIVLFPDRVLFVSGALEMSFAIEALPTILAFNAQKPCKHADGVRCLTCMIVNAKLTLQGRHN